MVLVEPPSPNQPIMNLTSLIHLLQLVAVAVGVAAVALMEVPPNHPIMHLISLPHLLQLVAVVAAVVAVSVRGAKTATTSGIG